MTWRRMLWASGLLSIFLAPAGCDIAAADPLTVRVTVRFLNGKTGQPIQGEVPNVWLDKSRMPVTAKTDFNGEVSFELDTSRVNTIRCFPTSMRTVVGVGRLAGKSRTPAHESSTRVLSAPTSAALGEPTWSRVCW